MIKYIFLIFFTLSIYSCNEKPNFWPENNTKFEAKFFKLSISDTSKILTNEGSAYKFVDLVDSLVTKLDTIRYTNPDKKTDKFFPNLKIKTVKSYSSNPNISEFYLFDHGSVKLAGFSTGDSLYPFSCFDNPLIIIPSIGIKSDSSYAIKQNWSVKKNQFVKDTKTKTKIKLKKTGTIIYEGQKQEFLLFELILTSDAKVSFGKKELIVPDAIYLKSLLLVSKTQGILYEWSIKGLQSQSNQNNSNELQKHYLFIELIKYNTLKH